MPIVFKRNGKLPKPDTQQPKAAPLAKTVCNEKQELINEVVAATLSTQNKSVLKMLENIKKLGVAGNVPVSDEYALQPICMRRQSAINQIKQVRKQLGVINDILISKGL